MNWARANFLLFDDPANGGALVYQFSDPESQDPYSPVWTADVGSPTGARFQVGAAWRRNFSGGTVLVNPTSSTVTVQLDKPYLQADGSTTSSVTLGATSGAVLRSSSTAPPPPPPPPPGPITLKASVAGTSVTLGWTGMTSANADVFRNGSRVATVSNTGAYLDRLPRKTKGTFSYRVCAAGTSTCSDTVSATVGQKVSPTFSSSLRAVHLAQRATRPLRALRARPARGRNGRSRAASR
ncbi:MAG: hypothetical protein AUI15_38135 [Actinobacteria bacterium 13_2_20CM_2_66_6]|nr:MAG: hypothetical protein AUI15_38135 [Actinobacteria bacterium 13_2_20CM_2_66_6]